jgi:outer membrane protein assembly factor BamB
MQNLIVAAAIIAAAAYSTAAQAAARNPDQLEDAVTFQINPARTGSTTFAAGFNAPLKKSWTFDTGGPVSYALVAGGTVFVVSNGNDLFALNAFTGKRHWEHLLSGGGNTGAYDHGMLFYESEEGDVTALLAKSGKQQWGARVGNFYEPTPPIALNGQVFFGPSLSAFDEVTGELQWTETEGAGGTPSYGDNGLYVGSPSQYFKYRAADGRLLWHNAGCCSGGGGILSAYFRKRVYLVDWAEGNFVLNSRTGEMVGSFPGGAPPTFFDGSNGRAHELVLSDGQLDCLNLGTGNVAWKFSSDQLLGQPIVVNGQPVIGSALGDVFMLDGDNGKTIWSANVGDSIAGLNAGDGMLAVSAGNSVTVYAPE